MFKWGASGSMNREPLSQSTDNYSPRLMSMDCPQHSEELTHSTPAIRSHKWQSLREWWFPAEVPEKTKVRLCGRKPPLPVPGMTLFLYYFSLLVLILPVGRQKVTVKVSFESQRQRRSEQSYKGKGNLKSLQQNRTQHFWGEATPHW